MRKLWTILAAALVLGPPALATAPIGYVTVTASNVSDSTGSLIVNATIAFTPVNNSGQPISYLSGGSGGGQAVSSAVTTVVTNGVFSIQLADTAMTNPVNLCYSVTVTDNVTGNSLLGPGYGCVQPTAASSGAAYTANSYWCSSSTRVCSFDKYIPNTAAGAAIETRPTGAASPACSTGTGTCVINIPLVGPAVKAQNINGVLNAAQFTGADIGAKVNAAISSLPSGCGTVLIPASSPPYRYSTTIVKPRCVNLEGQGPGSSVISGYNYNPALIYTGTTEAILIADNFSSDAYQYPRAGIRNLTILQGVTPPVSGTTAGIFFGGDDFGGLAPRSSGTVDNHFGQYQTLENVVVIGFTDGIMIGDNAFNETLLNCSIQNNNNGFSQVSSPIDSGENMTIIGGLIAGNTYAFNAAGTWNLSYPSLDFNGGSGGTANAEIYNTNIYWIGGHLEKGAGGFFSTNIGSFLYMQGVQVLLDTASATVNPWLIKQTKADYLGVIALKDDNFFTNEPTTTLINSDSGQLSVQGLVGNLNRSDGTVGGHPEAGIQALWNSSYAGIYYSSRLNEQAFGSNRYYTPTKWNHGIESEQVNFHNAPQVSNGAGASGYVLDLFDGTASAATPHKFFNVGSGNLFITNSARTSNIFTLTDTGAHSWGGGAAISSSSAVATTGTPTVGHAACIKAAGPPVVIGYCSSSVNSSGACNCN